MVDLKEKANGAIEQLYAYDKCLNESSDESKVSVCLVKPSKIKFKKLCQLGNICCTCFFFVEGFCVGVKHQG
jgi:hypothetical protein